MEKLVVLGDDGPVQEFLLAGQSISIGRDESNSICLGDKSVSRHHATLQRVTQGFTIEDARSTNGTRVNGRVITRQYLKHRDLLEIGKYHLRYLESALDEGGEDLDRTVVIRTVRQDQLRSPEELAVAGPPPAPAMTPVSSAPAPSSMPDRERSDARVRYLAGSHEGEELQVDRAFFSVGHPGGDLILINRRHTGYFLLKVGGDNPPRINGTPIKAGGVELHDGDRIELGELSLQFLLGESRDAG